MRRRACPLGGLGGLGEESTDFAHVSNEHLLGASALFARRAQHRRWVHRRKHRRRPLGFDGDAAPFHHAEGAPEERLCRSRSQADDHPRLDALNLRLEPGKARAHLACVGRPMKAALAPRILGPLEMLDGVRDVHVIAVDPRRIERAVEQSPGWTDERLPSLVLGVAWLLTHDHHVRGARPFTEDGLGAELIQMTAPTSFGRRAQRGECGARWDEISG